VRRSECGQRNGALLVDGFVLKVAYLDSFNQISGRQTSGLVFIILASGVGMKAMLAIPFVFLCGTASAQSIKSGNDLLQTCSSCPDPSKNCTRIEYMNAIHCAGYIKGAADVSRLAKSHCPPKDAPLMQSRDVVVNFLRRNPNVRHLEAGLLVAKALQEAWPCSSEPSLQKPDL